MDLVRAALVEGKGKGQSTAEGDSEKKLVSRVSHSDRA